MIHFEGQGAPSTGFVAAWPAQLGRYISRHARQDAGEHCHGARDGEGMGGDE